MGRDFKKSKYVKRHKEHIKGINKLTKKAKRYEPEDLKISKAKPLTSSDLPDRPEAPKMPKLKVPGNVLRSDKVAKPSGQPGTIKQYEAKSRKASQLKSTYKHAPLGGANKLAKFKNKVKGK
jgi:hypothetical protein